MQYADLDGIGGLGQGCDCRQGDAHRDRQRFRQWAADIDDFHANLPLFRDCDNSV